MRIAAMQTPAWIRVPVQDMLDGHYARQVENCGQQPVVDLRMDTQTRLGYAIARAHSVFIEVQLAPHEPLRRRWWAWTRVHLGQEEGYGDHDVLVEGWAARPRTAVRRVRDELTRQIYDAPFRYPFREHYRENFRDDPCDI